MDKKIIVAGSSNTDMVVKVPRIPKPGETIMGGEFMVIPGGKGANQAVACARMGVQTTFITCLGDDAFAAQSIENYKKDGIDTSFIKLQKGVNSGVALINVSEDGENCITVAPGANSYLFPSDIEALSDMIRTANIILVQLEIPMETVETIAQLAETFQIPFILNPAPAAKLSDDLLSKISVITPNETEAALLVSEKDTDEPNISGMANALFDKGLETVIITMGGKGVYLKTKEYDEAIPGYQVKTLDTTAAGDIFNGALAAALAGEKSIKEAIGFAQRAAAISVTRMGAQPSAPYLKEIMSFKQ